MKKLFFSLLAVGGLMTTSCSTDEIALPNGGEEVQATFTINVPQSLATRGASGTSSAQGGYSNAAGELNYTVALLNKKDGTVVWSSNTPDSKSANQATFTPTVVLGYTYQIVAYATFGNVVDAPAVGSAIVDGTSLANITTGKGINDESEDAYFVNDDILGAAQMQATLKRPFGKLRLVAEDYAQIAALGLSVESVKVTYKTAPETTFNVLSKNFSNVAASSEFVDEEENAYTNEDDRKEYTVFVDYLPAPTTGETFYPFEIEVKYADGKGTYTRSFTQDIPVKRNGLTTLRGNFFTTNAALTLTVDDNFDSETTGYISGASIGETHYDTLAEALNAAIETGTAATITLDGDNVLTYAPTKASANYSFEINGMALAIDLNGHTITANVADVTANSGIFRVIKGGELTIQGDGNINITTGKAPNCLTTFISNEAGIVNLKGGDWTLKAYDGWEDALIPCFVDNNTTSGESTLNISGGTYTFNRNLFRNFANNKTKKAIMNISGGEFNAPAEDPGLIWNQKPSNSIPEGQGVINVTGGIFNNVSIYNDFETGTNIVTSTEELTSAINEAQSGDVIALPAGEFKLTTYKAGVKLVGAGASTKVDVKDKQFGVHGDVNLENLTLVFSNNNYRGFQHTSTEVYTNCVIEGQPFLYGSDVTFNECTFKQTSSDSYNVWTYAATKVTFNDCKFECAGKSVLVYHDTNPTECNVEFNNCEFTASKTVIGKAAVQMHTEGDVYGTTDDGVYGTLKLNNTTAEGFDAALNGGLWCQINNPAKKPSSNFDIYLDGELMPENPIVSAEQLAAMGDKAAVGTYTLVADIDMTGVDMKPIMLGNGTLTINGNNHTIRNLNLVQSYQNGMWVSGLLNVMHSGSSLNVSNLTIDGVTSTSENYSSAVVAYNPQNNVTLNLANVDVKNATITAETVAALVGYTTGPVNLTNCDVASLSLTGETDRPDKVGAYIGTANGSDCVVTISNCTNNTSYNNVGRVIYDATLVEK